MGLYVEHSPYFRVAQTDEIGTFVGKQSFSLSTKLDKFFHKEVIYANFVEFCTLQGLFDIMNHPIKKDKLKFHSLKRKGVIFLVNVIYLSFVPIVTIMKINTTIRNRIKWSLNKPNKLHFCQKRKPGEENERFGALYKHRIKSLKKISNVNRM